MLNSGWRPEFTCKTVNTSSKTSLWIICYIYNKIVYVKKKDHMKHLCVKLQPSPTDPT